MSFFFSADEERLRKTGFCFLPVAFPFIESADLNPEVNPADKISEDNLPFLLKRTLK